MIMRALSCANIVSFGGDSYDFPFLITITKYLGIYFIAHIFNYSC